MTSGKNSETIQNLRGTFVEGVEGINLSEHLEMLM